MIVQARLGYDRFEPGLYARVLFGACSRAGIDPRNLLIDVKTADNLREVTP